MWTRRILPTKEQIMGQSLESKKMKPDEILMKASELYEKKSEEYGDNWKRVGPILRLVFRNIIPQNFEMNREGPWYWERIHLITMIVIKLTRFIVAMEKGENHKDSTRDLVVYAAMLDSLEEE